MDDKKWNLDQLYTSYNDEYNNDMNRVKELFEELSHYPDLAHTEKNLVSFLKKNNQLNDLLDQLFAYVNLRINADTQDNESLKYQFLLQNMVADFAESETKIEKWLAVFDVDQMGDPYVKQHCFYLNEVKTNSQYLLDDESEKVLANMKINGSSAWLNYKDQVISSMKVEMDGHQYPLTEVLNMAYSKDKETRKKAYFAEIDAYKNTEDAIVASLNAIKGEALTVVKMRGYDSVLDRTLKDSRMSRETLDALLDTIKDALPLFERYFKLKAQALGYDNGLPWYDMYAPIVDVDMEYPYQQGCDFVVKQFSSFSKNLGDYAKHAIDQGWIDVYPRDHKVGGAFCENLHCIKESRFLLNYGNQFSDVITLSHELGHGFHGHCLDNETALNADYPMPIAETASTFSETIVKKAALKDASKEQQLMILENELSDCAQVIVDIYSRYLFESRFIEKRKEGPLTVDQIKDLMIEAQKEAYLDGLDHNYLHPYMWTWKPHYYDVDYAFYNFPYAFGLLFAKGLYGMYIKEGPAFSQTYEKLLSLTGKMSLEDIGKEVGIDITDRTFWHSSIDMIKEDIDLFEQLLKE